jgi:hypothetical protein
MILRTLTLLCACSTLLACSESNPVSEGCTQSSDCTDQVCKNDPDDGLDGICVDCLVSDDCPTDTPFCDVASNRCLSPTCEQGADGDALCMSATPDTPVCGPNGRCVECVESSHCSNELAPVCDTETGECRQCEAHAECVSGVCDIEGGTCRAEADLVYVDDNGTDGASCGTPLSPCATFMGADGALTKVGGSRDTIVVQTGSIEEQVAIDSMQLTIVGQPGAALTPVLPSDEIGIAITDSATVTISGLRISTPSQGDRTIAVACTGNSTLTLEDSLIDTVKNGISTNNCSLTLLRSDLRGSSNRDSTGIEVAGGEVALHQSTITNHLGGGIRIDSASFEIVNCLIANNGNDSTELGSPFGGILLSGTLGDQRFEFNTVAHNFIQPQQTIGSAIECADANLNGSNNIFTLDGAPLGLSTLIGANCSLRDSLIEGGHPGEGNINDTPIFVPAADDYHLVAGSPGIDVAVGGTEVAVDIDGDARPQGARRDMGMDEVLVQ